MFLAVVLGVFLIVSTVFTERSWNLSYDNHAAGGSIVWANNISRFFVSAYDAIAGVRLEGDALVREMTVVHGLGDDPLAYGNGWLYFVGSGRLLVLDVHNPGRPQWYGPVVLGGVFGPGSTFGVVARKMRVENDDLLIAGRLVGPNGTGPGMVLTIDMANPASVTENPASLRVRHALRFNSSVMDVLVSGPILYVLEPSRIWRYTEADGQPLPEAPHVLGGSCVGFDLSGSLLAVADAGQNRSVLLYEVSDAGLRQVARAALSGGPSQVTLADSLLYVSWHPDGNLQRGLMIFDLPEQGTPRLLAQFSLEGFGSSHLVVNRTTYLPGNWDIAVVRQVSAPLIVNPLVAIVAAVWAASTVVALLVLRRRTRGLPARSAHATLPRF